MTALARLNEVLKWLNGDFDEFSFPDASTAPLAKGGRIKLEPYRVFTNPGVIRSMLARFIASFDGSVDVGFVSAADDEGPPLDDDALGDLRSRLHILLQCGFDGPKDAFADGFDGWPAPTLRFMVRSAGRKRPGWRLSKQGNHVRVGGRQAKDAHQARGAYVLHAMGSTADLMPFLLAHLLTQRDMVAVRRCKRRLCDRFVVIDVNKRGRRREYCRPSCIDLDKEEEAYRKAREKTNKRGTG